MRKDKTPGEKWRDIIKVIVFPIAFVWWLYTSGVAELEESIGHINFLFETKIWFTLALCVFLGMFTYRTSYNNDELSMFYFFGVIFSGLFILKEFLTSSSDATIDTDKLIVATILLGLFVGIFRRSVENRSGEYNRNMYFKELEKHNFEELDDETKKDAATIKETQDIGHTH